MLSALVLVFGFLVALRTEGVDRNMPDGDIVGGYGGRPPYGGRG